MYSLSDFFSKPENRKYRSRYEFGPLTLQVFQFISIPDNIHNIIQAINSNRPAIEGLIPDLENTLLRGIVLDDMFKQMIGSMIKYFISDLGYETTDKIPTLKSKRTVFKSGTRYIFNPSKAKRKLEIKYDIINLPDKRAAD